MNRTINVKLILIIMLEFCVSACGRSRHDDPRLSLEDKTHDALSAEKIDEQISSDELTVIKNPLDVTQVGNSIESIFETNPSVIAFGGVGQLLKQQNASEAFTSLDSDGDLFEDFYEIFLGSSPNDPNSTPLNISDVAPDYSYNSPGFPNADEFFSTSDWQPYWGTVKKALENWGLPESVDLCMTPNHDYLEPTFQSCGKENQELMGEAFEIDDSPEFISFKDGKYIYSVEAVFLQNGEMVSGSYFTEGNYFVDNNLLFIQPDITPTCINILTFDAALSNYRSCEAVADTNLHFLPNDTPGYQWRARLAGKLEGAYNSIISKYVANFKRDEIPCTVEDEEVCQ